MSYRGHFDAIAGRYDDLRGELLEETLPLLVEHGDLAGRRVLDAGSPEKAPPELVAQLRELAAART